MAVCSVLTVKLKFSNFSPHHKDCPAVLSGALLSGEAVFCFEMYGWVHFFFFHAYFFTYCLMECQKPRAGTIESCSFSSGNFLILVNFDGS